MSDSIEELMAEMMRQFGGPKYGRPDYSACVGLDMGKRWVDAVDQLRDHIEKLESKVEGLQVILNDVNLSREQLLERALSAESQLSEARATIESLNKKIEEMKELHAKDIENSDKMAGIP